MYTHTPPSPCPKPPRQALRESYRLTAAGNFRTLWCQERVLRKVVRPALGLMVGREVPGPWSYEVQRALQDCGPCFPCFHVCSN